MCREEEELVINLNQEIWTVAEVAAYLRVSEATIYKLVRKKEIPGKRIGRSWRFWREEIEKWLKSQSRAAGRNRGEQ